MWVFFWGFGGGFFGFLLCFGAKTLGAGSSVMPGENPRVCVYTQTNRMTVLHPSP